MALTNISDALKHIYQLTQNKSNSPSTTAGNSTSQANATTDAASNSPQFTDIVSLRKQQGLNPLHKIVTLNDYKDAVSKDSQFVKDTLKSKLTELGLPDHTQIQISKDEQGNLVAQGNIQQQALDQINQDLNNNKPFKAAFSRLSVNQPTLDYVGNVVNLSKAYGVDNNLFGSLMSQQQDNNNLTDIASRYDKLKATFQTDPLAATNSIVQNKHYQFVLNG
jgi:hypothetical protein